MTKNELKSALDAKGIQYSANATVAELQALLDKSNAGHVEPSYGIKLPKTTPVHDTGFTLPNVSTPSRLTIGRKDASGADVPLPKSGDRTIVPIRMGNNMFVQWNDTLQGNIEAEQARLDKQGVGVQIYKVDGDFFTIDENLEWTCTRNNGLKVNA